MNRSRLGAVSLLVLAACAPAGDASTADASAASAGTAFASATSDSTVHLAHEAYTTAINSNDLDAVMAMMTDDVVFLAAHASPMVGKDAVRPWVQGYLEAFVTHWDKQTQEFEVAGEWAFERYSYTSTDTPRGGGEPITDTGWGLVIYHHDADGTWRVAYDAFGTDQPVQAQE